MARTKSEIRSARSKYLEELATREKKEKSGRSKYNEMLAKRHGYKSMTDMLNAKAIEKGHKSHSDYLKQLIEKKGKTLYEYQTELITKKIDKKECEALKKLNEKYPKILKPEAKNEINKKCKSRLLSEII